MRQANGHAVVLGAGMGGLLAARALADHFGRVTVVERDELPAAARDRRGVPQGRHLHGLLARGVQSLDALFPGLVDELVADGAPQARFLAEVQLVFSGHQLARGDAGVTAVQATRPMLERAVRSRVAGLPNVKLVDGVEVAGRVARDGRVAGVRIMRPGTAGTEEVLEADLVVDAMGRAGRTRTWLSELGYDPPVEERVKCDLSYVSRFLRMPEGALAFARTVAPAEVYAAIRRAEPLSELATHKVPASVRRRYERLRRFPDGLLVFGDAICSFNPIYGRGMSVAAVEAEALRRCLEAGDHDLAGRFFRAAAKAVDPAWKLAAGGDLTLPEVPGRRRPSTRVVNRYVRRLHRVAAYDAKVAAAFVRVAGLVDPPSAIMTPAVAGRVLLGRRRRP